MNRLAKLTTVLLVSGGAAVQSPSPLAAQGTCLDTAWARYNGCLMSTNCEWAKYLCDIQFWLDVDRCVSRVE